MRPVISSSAALLDRASLYAETYLTRNRDTKRPRRVATFKSKREAQKPGPCVRIDCQNLDIVL